MTPEQLKEIYANCNSWWEVAKVVNAIIEQLRTQLAVAQKEAEDSDKAYDDIERQLAAAQAQIVEHNAKQHGKDCRIVYNDATALDAAIAAAKERSA